MLKCLTVSDGALIEREALTELPRPKLGKLWDLAIQALARSNAPNLLPPEQSNLGLQSKVGFPSLS
jgi:hypothetical protein